MKRTFDPSTLRPNFWEAAVRWEKFGKDVILMVEPVESAVEDFQIRYIDDFLNWDPSIYDSLEEPTYKYYEAMCRLAGDTPFIGSKKNIWSWIDPNVAIVPRYSNGTNNYMRFEINCHWEVEHGLEWVIRNGRDILYVGPYEGKYIGDLEGGPANG